MTQVTGSIYLVDGASILLSAWLIDKWVARGASLNKAYKTSLALAGAGVGTCLIASAAVGPAGAVVALLVMGAMDGMNGGMIGVVSQTFAGPSAAGRWVGIQNAVGNVAGMVAPVTTGYLVQQTGNYTAALLLSGGAALVGVIAWVVVTPAVRPIEWSVNQPRTSGVKATLRDVRPV
jgi:nitrate/nitrite transporter NarK